LDPRENTPAPIEIPAERKPVDRGEAAVARDFQRQMDDEIPILKGRTANPASIILRDGVLAAIGEH